MRQWLIDYSWLAWCAVLALIISLAMFVVSHAIMWYLHKKGRL